MRDRMLRRFFEWMLRKDVARETAEVIVELISLTVLFGPGGRWHGC